MRSARGVDSSTGDVIVVLGATVLPDGRPSKALCRRVDWAVELFKQGRAQAIIMSGGPVATAVPEAEAMAARARQAGVPAKTLIMENRSRNTFENAVFTQDILKRHGFNDVILVSDGWHLPRATRVFRHFGVSVTASAAASGDYPEPLWRLAFCLVREAAAAVKYAYLLKQRRKAEEGG